MSVKPEFPASLSGRRISALEVAGWPPMVNVGQNTPAEYIARESALVNELFAEHGALVLRGGKKVSANSLRDVVTALEAEPIVYKERSTRRRAVGQDVYTSTEHPASQHILPHHENAYASAWPRLLVFGCVQPATTGGQTPIYDGYRVFAALDPQIVSELACRGVRHQRTFGTGFGLTAEEAFGATSRSDLEQKVRAAGLSFEWIGDDVLRTHYDTLPILKHPTTGQLVLFSHVVFFHQDNLPDDVRSNLIDVVGVDNLPHTMTFADGTPIPGQMVQSINKTYEQCESLLEWQQGDVVLLDNMRCGHGRRPYTGNRSILVALANEMQRSEADFV